MSEFQIFAADSSTILPLPYADEGIVAGFPSPAQDFMTESIDLNKYLVHHSESTFYARAVGNSMKDANISEGDLLVIDKSIEPTDGVMAICFLNGEFTVKFLEYHEGYILLRPANEDYSPIRVNDNEDFKIWGIVTYIIRKAPHMK